jgi:hypothetical protein
MPWGFHVEGLVSGPVVTSGALLVGQHSEASNDGAYRFYLDRFDFSDPAAPRELAAVEIPGSVLDFDASSGGLITLETLLVREHASPEGCPGDALFPDARQPTCSLLRRALNGLVVEDDRARRVGRLLLDGDGRNVVRFAVSRGSVYYVTHPSALGSDEGGPFAAREVSIERVALRDGRFERLPSFDIAGSSDVPPEHWEQFAASGGRALWVAGGQLMLADFTGGEPRIEAHDIGPWGCTSLALEADAAYCAQGQAGYLKVTLGQQ